jgi:hypothetical protein
MSFRHPISIMRRANGVVDLVIDNQPGNDYFELDFSQNFAGSYTDTVTVQQGVGSFSESLNARISQGEGRNHGQTGKTRYVFNPADIGTSGLDDSTLFWVQLTINAGTAAGTCIPYPVTPTITSQHYPLIIKGTAPSQTSIADSLQIILPATARDAIVKNNSTSIPIWLGVEPSGDELEIPPKGTTAVSTIHLQGVTQIFVRGASGTADFVFTADLNFGN